MVDADNGRYQITNQTAQFFGFTDWTPTGQDNAAATMPEYYDAVQPAVEGDFQQAAWNMFSWASMPDSPLPGRHMSMQTAADIFNNALHQLPHASTDVVSEEHDIYS